MRRLKVVIGLCVFLMFAPTQADVLAVGLMQGMAILEVDGKRVVIKAGQTRSGVKLIESNSRQAIVEMNGQQETLMLGVSLTGSYSEPTKSVVRLPRGENGHYFASARINGHPIRVLVDTGASFIGLSSQTAKKLGINYASGRKGRSSTANGIVKNYTLRLDHVQIGGIKLYGVMASIIEGNFPDIPLLGMSFLNKVKMHEEQGMLILTDTH